MVIDQTSPVDLFRSLRMQISTKGLRAFKVSKFVNVSHSHGSESKTSVQHNRRSSDRQLATNRSEH